MLGARPWSGGRNSPGDARQRIPRLASPDGHRVKRLPLASRGVELVVGPAGSYSGGCGARDDLALARSFRRFLTPRTCHPPRPACRWADGTMVDESYLIRCPGCGNTKRVEMAVGQQLQCDVCQTKFFAPVVTTEPRPASKGEIVHDSPSPLPSPQTTELVAGVVDSPAGLDATPPTSAETPSRGWRLGDSTAPPPGSTDAPLADARRATDRTARTDVSPPGDLPEPAAQRAPRTGEPDASGRIWTWISALAGVVIVGVSAAACAYLLRDWATQQGSGQQNCRPTLPS